ncbi:hypothetical protein MMC24_007144 [Lignoscripta atroalba]|nr:hypothetical protein [Lignoscripta atroalba]
MADPLYELLAPYFDESSSSRPIPSVNDTITTKYLNRLATLPLASLTTTEPQSLAQSAHSSLLSLQALSTRSSRSVIASADHLSSLRTALPTLAAGAGRLQDGILTLDREAVQFSTKFSRSGDNEILDRRKKALLMSRNVDRLSDILDLPTLLSSAIASSTTQGASSNTSYASALDLHSHIKRLHLLYQDSELVTLVYDQAEEAMREMTTNLIASLRAQSIKLASAMRTIGWLRRIAPELDGGSRQYGAKSGEGSFGALFLVCRLANLMSMLEALDPLRELANQETQRRLRDKENATTSNAWSGGQQTERYLKRYIEIFREQSFAIVSMYKSIFPAPEASNGEALDLQLKSFNLKTAAPERVTIEDDPLQPLPSALSTFPLHLVGLLSETLKEYLPNVRDKSSRESLLTQVLYCAGSLGRLGGDFSMILALLEDDDSDDDDNDDGSEEWVEMMKKHRELAGRLELLASGVGTHATVKSLR